MKAYQPTWHPPDLPMSRDMETIAVLKKLSQARATLGELKGLTTSLPNAYVLINAIALKEAKDSSEIENIVTTNDDLYKAVLDLQESPAAKEVRNYARAIQTGYDLVRQTGVIQLSTILKVQEVLEENSAGLRSQPGTTLQNAHTGEVVFIPPQNPDEIRRLMQNLVEYMNDDSLSSLDSLVKMAIIHFQFESIHPFYDGNGRTGRILNILYLIQQGILDYPILYMSSFIIRQKSHYYRLLQSVRTDNTWEEWVLYMLDAVYLTAKEAIQLIQRIRQLMLTTKHDLRSRYKFYSQDLINSLFQHPYTKIEYVMHDLKVSRPTATKYLDILAADGYLTKFKLGKAHYFIHEQLLRALQ